MFLGIIGVNGYTGQGLLQALSLNQDYKVTLVTSRGDAGKSLAEANPSLMGVPAYEGLELVHPDFLEDIQKKDPQSFPEIFFLAVSHGASMKLVPRILKLGARVIDLTGDFRLKDKSLYPKFYKMEHSAPELLQDAVYGLPELHREDIMKAKLVANPGCYPTSIILAAAPLAKNSLLKPHAPLIADSKSGVSGAGKRAEVDYSYCELNDNFKAYKIVGHQHTPEAKGELEALTQERVSLSFTPHLAPMSRGILTTLYAQLKDGVTLDQIHKAYLDFYRDAPFVRLRLKEVSVNVLDVRGTNFCDLSMALDEEAGVLKVISVIDNLSRGAVTQALVNLNLMTGKSETQGIPLVALRP